jgi:hypothetical protein
MEARVFEVHQSLPILVMSVQPFLICSNQPKGLSFIEGYRVCITEYIHVLEYWSGTERNTLDGELLKSRREWWNGFTNEIFLWRQYDSYNCVGILRQTVRPSVCWDEHILNIFVLKFAIKLNYSDLNLIQFLYRPEKALRGFRWFMSPRFGDSRHTWRWLGCQPYIPAAFTPHFS